jgi:hypothetical protein
MVGKNEQKQLFVRFSQKIFYFSFFVRFPLRYLDIYKVHQVIKCGANDPMFSIDFFDDMELTSYLPKA